MHPYNSVKRIPSDQGGSVNFTVPLMQEGLAASSINTAYTFIPCDMKQPKHVKITPVKLSTTSANGVAFFTTTGGWQVDSLTSLTAISGVDDWAQNVAYVVGNVVLNPDDDTAYICIVAHTSTNVGTEAVDWATDIAAGYWQELPATTKFIKLTHTAAGANKVANFTYEIQGY